MTTKFIQCGDKLAITLAANANSGDLVVVNNLFGVAETSGSTGDVVTVATGGVWALPKANAASTLIAVGGNVYWDGTNSKVTISATSNTRIGVATVAASNTDTTAYVRLNESF